MKIALEAGSNTIGLENPVASRQDSAAVQYAKMGRELMRATAEYADRNGTEERPIVYSVCEWGRNLPWLGRGGRQSLAHNTRYPG